MVARTSVLQSAPRNRRRRVRHKIQTPAYACFRTESQSSSIDLHEIVDISEDGIAIQCHTPLEVNRQVHLCLDLADCPEQIYTTAQVIWSGESSRSGLRFFGLSTDSALRLREWLFVNVMSGVANGEVDLSAVAARKQIVPPPSYTDRLAAVTAVQRQVEALGSDLAAALQLIAERSRSLVRASGAAIALADAEPDSMVCRASSGEDAPPAGARLQVGSGFSGECVRKGRVLRCDDTETDEYVDRESCRALGIRSILAVPVRAGDESVGLLEVFSRQPQAFGESDGVVLQRLSETVLDAANRAARAESLPPLGAPPPAVFAPQPGSVLFASAPTPATATSEAEPKEHASLTLPRRNLIILVCAAATIAMALGYRLAPWIQREATPWVQNKLHARAASAQLPTVLASSQPPKAEDAPSQSTIEIDTASLDRLRQMAESGNSAAANALGLRYAMGDGIELNESEAVRWFTKAAEGGNVAAQSKLGSIYYSGRGVPQDINRAYFWMVLARTGGDEASITLAPHLRARLTRGQVAAIELEADRWMQMHQTNLKPAPGVVKPRY